jgi:c-di-GMP-binding flagellar brake protein YcgR
MLPGVNQILQMQVASFDEDEAKQEYKSRVADMNSKYISMEVPLHVKSGKLKRLYVGDQLSVNFVTEGGVKNYFNTEVIGFKEDIFRLVIIRTPEPEAITRVQRRSFLRVPAELEVGVKISEHLRFTAMTDDVGGGGVSFICEDTIPLTVKDNIHCWLLIHYKNKQIEHVGFRGDIVRIKPADPGSNLVMVGFTDICDTERQKIIRYCFERQLELRKK